MQAATPANAQEPEQQQGIHDCNDAKDDRQRWSSWRCKIWEEHLEENREEEVDQTSDDARKARDAKSLRVVHEIASLCVYALLQTLSIITQPLLRPKAHR